MNLSSSSSLLTALVKDFFEETVFFLLRIERIFALGVDTFSEEPGLQGGRDDRNVFILFKKIGGMDKVGIIVFGTLQINDQMFGVPKK